MEEAIYNMDETGLFWRKGPSSGLMTQSRPGVKKDKESDNSCGLYQLHWVRSAASLAYWKCKAASFSQKSTVIQAQILSLPTEPQPDVSHLYTRAPEVGRIQDMMSLANFLNPPDEDFQLAEEDSLQSIISCHTGNESQDGVDEAPSDNEEDIIPATVPSLQQALRGLHTVLRHKEHCEDTTMEGIRALERLERQLATRETSEGRVPLIHGLVVRDITIPRYSDQIELSGLQLTVLRTTPAFLEGSPSARILL